MPPSVSVNATTSGDRNRVSITSANSPPTMTMGIVPAMISRPSRSYSPSRPLSAPGAAAINFATSARKKSTTASSVPT